MPASDGPTSLVALDATEAFPTLRVLLVLRADGVGGAERSMANLIVALDSLGVGWDLVTLQQPRGRPGPLAAYQPRVLDFPSRSSRVSRLRQLRWLRAAMRGDHYRAAIAFGPLANCLISLARSRNGSIAILSERGDPFVRERRPWNRWFMWAYRRADLLVVPTERLAAEVLYHRSRPREVKVICNALAPGIPIVGREEPRKRTIAFVGRLAPKKRVADLIDAIDLLGDRADGWNVVIVGDGSERRRLETLVQVRSLARRVTFVGVHPAPWELLARADLFVLCSAHEGFPNVLLEAMASGCSVVASDCRFGPDELVESGVDGILYPPGDVERLAAVLGELIDDPERRDSLARGAVERARTFTIEAIAPLWLEAITAERAD